MTTSVQVPWGWTGGAMRATAAGPTATVNPAVRVCLLAFVASIPFESPSRSIPMEVPTLFGFILLAASLLNPSACYRRIPAFTIAFALYLWVIVAVTVAVGVTNRQLVARFFITMLQLVALAWVIANLGADRRVLRSMLLAFVLACAVRAGIQLLGIATTASPVWTGGTRLTTLGQNPNLSAIILSAGLVTTVGLWRSALAPPTWLRLTAIPFAAMMGVAIIQSGSRGGLLCAAAGLAALGLRGATVATRVRNVLLGIGAVAALGVGAWRSEMMRHRLEESATEGRLAGREVIYPAAAGMFLERPLMGWGPIENQFEIARRIRERGLPRRDAHNLLLELSTSTGVLGTLPFLIGLGLAVHAAWRARTGALGLLPLGLMAAVLTGTISGTWIASKVLWLAIAVAAAADAPTDGEGGVA